MTLFKNKYRIESTRLKGWDYANPGFYFVTLCTKNRINHFGKIINNTILLSDIGNIVNTYWQKIPEYFNNTELDEYQIMPNHIHGIIIIACCRDVINDVSTITTTKTGGITGKYNPMTSPYSLSKIIRWFKGRCTFEINTLHPGNNFSWQSRFYDHIIRDKESLYRIRQYIRDNPKKWHLRSTDVIHDVY